MKKIFHGLIALPLLITSYSAFCASEVYGPTVANEHLYRIALRVRPNHSYSVQQVMLAILKKNPSAFTKSNVNCLKSGYRLVIPTLADLAKIQPHFAFQQVVEQNKAWLNNETLPPTTIVLKNNKQVKDIGHFIDAASQSVPELHSTANYAFHGPLETTMTSFNLNSTSSPEIKTLTEATTHFQEQTTGKIENLQRQTKDLEVKVNDLTEQLRGLTYQFIQLSALIKSNNSTFYLNNVMDNVKKYAPTLGGSLLVLIVLGWLYRMNTKPKAAVKKAPVQDEYDFLDDDENIPTKLDLARAYIDMGDEFAAKNTLKDVLIKGDKQQREAARDLMGKLSLG